tara:strand:+ start:6593 stop:7948 length:1356 start_codon:yes stop_codon:yes gene_type:complete
MSDYIVKFGGNATLDAGRYTTPQTGSFAALGVANYYNSINDALAATTPPISGDRIIISDLHVFNPGGNVTITNLIPNPFFVISVDDSNIDQSRANGNFSKEGANNLSLSQGGFYSGLYLDIGNDLNLGANATLIFQDGIIAIDSAGDEILDLSGDGVTACLVNTELKLDSTTPIIKVGGGSEVTFVNCTTSTNTGGVTRLFSGGFATGGGSVNILDSDLSVVTGTLFEDVGGNAISDDLININGDHCKIATGVAFTNETFKSYNQRALFTRCSDTPSATPYQYHLHAFGGDVDDDTTVFRDQDEQWAGTATRTSFKVVTNSDASLGTPLWFEPTKNYADLSSSSTIRFFITSDTALTDKDIYIDAGYSTSGSENESSFKTTAPATVGGTIDLMATGTTLTTDGTSTWTGGKTFKYQIDLVTTSGADADYNYRINITKPSATLYVATSPLGV